MEKQEYKDIKKPYEVFLNEWCKIENEISNEFYNLYILKEIIDIARCIRPDYMKSNTRDNAIKFFQKNTYETLNKVSKFCNPKNIHFEKMLCSLYVLAKNIEGILYEIINSQMDRKQKEYDKLILKTTEQIFATINVNIPDEYVYNTNTQVLIIDNVLKKNDLFSIPNNQLENINKLSSIAQGTYIYDLYKQIQS